MKNRLLKSMTMIIAIAMLISMVPVAVSATGSDVTIDNVEVTIGDVDPETGSAQVTVTATGITGEMTDYTLLAVRHTAELGVEDLTTTFPSTEEGNNQLENQIEYIDQGDAEVSEGTLTRTFTLRGADLSEMQSRTDNYGDVINVFLGGTLVSANGGSDTYELPKKDAPVVSADKVAIYADEAVAITVTDPAVGYVSGAVVKVNGSEVSVNKNENIITIPEETLSAGPNVITIECEGFHTTQAITVTVKEVVDRFTDTTPKGLNVTKYNDQNPDALAVVTVPEAYTDPTTKVEVTYASYTVDGVGETEITGTSFEVERNPVNGVSKEVVVNVKLSYGGSETTTTVKIDVTAKGVVGYTVVAGDVNIVAPAGGAYKREHAKLITIKLPVEGAIDVTNQVVKIGDNQLYYTPERTKDYTGQNEGTKYTFVGLIIDETNAYATADAVAAATKIENGTLTKLYYGLPANTTADRGVNISDLSVFVGAYNKDSRNEDAGLPADKLISMDIYGAGSANISVGSGLVGAYNSDGGLTKNFAIINK